MGELIGNAIATAGDAPLVLLAIVAVLALGGGAVPGIPLEPVLLGVAAVAPRSLLPLLVVVATVAQMIAKTALCVGAARLAATLSPPRRAQVDRACAALARRPRLRLATLTISAIAGVPPFYVTTLAYGAMRLPLRTFVAIGTAGRLLRFTTVVLAPQLLVPATVRQLLPAVMHPDSLLALSLAAVVGALAGTHAAIWGMYKDALHEGFAASRFARSIVVGAAAGVLAQLVLHLALPAPSALLLLFGVAYATERGAIELWKSFVRVEDQSKYFIPMAFSVRGVPVTNRWLRLGAGAIHVAAFGAAIAAFAWLDRNTEPPLDVARTALVGLGVGTLIALGGAWKDAPTEGFDPLKFLRSPSVTVVAALLLGRVAESYLVVATASIGFERAIVETWKKFGNPLQPPGKFAGKPVTHPHMLGVRRRFVPVFVAIWLAVLGSAAVAMTAPRPRAAVQGPTAAARS